MNQVALRSLLSRKLRTILTMIAIVLGVSMISGTYVMTDTIDQSFNQIFVQANSKTNVIISGKQIVGGEQGRQQVPSFPESLLGVVQRTPGVAAAGGQISDTAELVGANGQSLGATRGAPSLLFSWLGPRFSVLKLVRGHAPTGDQIVLDGLTMSRHHLRVGQSIGVVAVGAVQQFTIVGEVKFGTVSSLGGASLISVDLPTAQRITGKRGRLDVIRVIGASGVTALDLAQRIQARIPPALRSTVKVQTAQQNANEAAAAIGNALGSLTNILLAFGYIALFVGAFVIFNTFSITVAQRSREFALLRTLGATQAQVLRSVILEALLVGVVASVIGLFAGLGIAQGLNRLFVAFGVDLPSTTMVVATRTVVVALVVGIVVTLAASLLPAIRATRVPPIAALQEGAQLPIGRFQRFMPVIGPALTAIGVVLMAVGILANISQTSERLSLIGAGALLLFIGAAVLSPMLVPPLANLVGWPIERLTRIAGRLARENTVRNPIRTAVTAAALMVGLALVGFVTIFAAELKRTALDTLDRELAGTFAIYSDQGRLIPSGAEGAVAHVPGVTTVSALKISSARLNGIGEVQTNGLQPASLAKVYRFQWKEGSTRALTSLGASGALVDENLAKNNHLHVGSRLQATTAAGIHATFTVAGIYKTTQLLPDWCIRYDTMTKDWRLSQDYVIVADIARGQNVNTMKARISRALLHSYPTANVHSQQDLKNQNVQSINQLLALVYVLLAMSVLVSLFGIINTLVLSVYERTREIGMLRAIGTTRSQVGWIVRWESVITAIIGAVLGLVLGIVLAMLVTLGLQSQGIEYALPFGQLLIWVVFAMVFGVVAAVYPAWRAARLDVLRAIAYE